MAELPQKHWKWYFALILIFILVLAFFSLWNSHRHQPELQLTEADVIAEMKLRAADAVESARNQYEKELDFSPESVDAVEEILSQVHLRHQQSPLSEQQLSREALKWGAYLGEVIKTQKQAEWGLDSVIGKGTLPLKYGDNSASFPVGWCLRRIVNGEVDNVAHKYLYATGQIDMDRALTIPLEEDPAK